MIVLKLSLEALVLLLVGLSSYYDIKFRRIPNLIIIFLMVTNVFYIIINNILLDSLLGMFIPALLFVFINGSYGNFIGNGDIKLLAAIGLFIGYKGNLMVFTGSCIACIVFTVFSKLLFKKSIPKLPLAPFTFFCLFIYMAVKYT